MELERDARVSVVTRVELSGCGAKASQEVFPHGNTRRTLEARRFSQAEIVKVIESGSVTVFACM